jgi:hypothetical protein
MIWIDRNKKKLINFFFLLFKLKNHRNFNDASKKHQTSVDIKRTVVKKPKWTYNKVINHFY